MTLETLLSLLAQVIYLWVAINTLRQWISQRDEAHRDIFLVFLSLAIAILAQDLQRLLPALAPGLTPVFYLALLFQPYFVLRVARYSLPISRAAWRLLGAGMILASLSLLLLEIAPLLPLLLCLGFFLAAETGAALLLRRGARLIPGITGRRLGLAALGSGFLVLIFLLALAVSIIGARSPLSPAALSITGPIFQLLAILSGVSYYLGFSPPRWLRRLLQLEDVHSFLSRVSTREKERSPVIPLLTAASRAAVGSADALLLQWDQAGNCLRAQEPGMAPVSIGLSDPASLEVQAAWSDQRSRMVLLPAAVGAGLTEWASQWQARSLYLVPLIGSTAPRGMLITAMPHVPLFARDDLDLLDLLAGQAALQLDHASLVEDLEDANRSLRERIDERERAETRFRGLLESAPDSIVVVDEAGKIQLVNSQVESMFGYSRQELLGQKMEILVPKRFQKKHVRHRENYNVDHPARPMGADLELFAVRKNGTEFPVEISLSPLQLESGMLITAAIRDVTRRKRTEEEIQRLNKDLEQRAAQMEAANKELESFSYSVSHDLRAPLRSIDGFSQAVLEDYGDSLPAEGRGYLERVRAAAQRMAVLIDDLLNLSRVTRAALHPKFMNLSAVAEEVVSNLQEQHPDRRVQVSIAPDLMVEGDPNLLRIVMENLLSNAWKFTSRREDASIEFGQNDKNHHGERTFFVRDNGVGFDMAYVDKLFGVFQRLHSVTDYPGTGVGLATVQRIVKIHGGRIWAESAEGRGTTFYFTL